MPPLWWKAALTARCPACGKAPLFRRDLISIIDKCPSCHFPLKNHDVGDGGVFFAMFLAMIVIAAIALTVELLYQPPLWLHALLWIPLTLVMVIGGLRVFKAFFVALQYRHRVLGYREK